MISRPSVASAARMESGVVRRRRLEVDGPGLPRHLWVDAVKSDPLAWRNERFEWSQTHDWPASKVGFLDFFRETRDTYRRAMGIK